MALNGTAPVPDMDIDMDLDLGPEPEPEPEQFPIEMVGVVAMVWIEMTFD